VDECKDWADKALALASYAKQADDDELFTMARRIQGRAVRRVGELLPEFQNAGARTDIEPRGGSPPRLNGAPLTQRQAAERAGLSKDQEKVARRVAAIPGPDFEAAIESPNPPSVTGLADLGLGRNARPKPEGFAHATHLIGATRRLAEFCSEHEPAYIAGGVLPDETPELLAAVTKIDSWLTRFRTHLKEA
jgi:hypothetical protein